VRVVKQHVGTLQTRKMKAGVRDVDEESGEERARRIAWVNCRQDWVLLAVHCGLAIVIFRPDC